MCPTVAKVQSWVANIAASSHYNNRSFSSKFIMITDLDRCFFYCLYGNNEEEVIIREVKRDFEYEAEMVFLEQYFWENHVQRLSLIHI